MPDISIDKISLQIESDSSKAVESIDKLTQSLTSLSSIYDRLGRTAGAIEKIANSISLLKDSKLTGFQGTVTKLKALSEIDFLKNNTASATAAISSAFRDLAQSTKLLADTDTSSVSKIVNAFTRLSKVGEANTESAAKSMRELSIAMASLGKSGDVGDSLSNASKLINSFSRLTGNATDVDFASAIPKATQAIRDFISEMSDMPEVSDNTVRLAEAFALMSRSGTKAGDALRRTSTSASSLKVAETVVDSFGSALKKLISIFKKLGTLSVKAFGSIASGVKQLASSGIGKIKDLSNSLMHLGRSTGNVQNLTSRLKTLLGVVIGFRGIYGVFNWLKDSVSAGADVAEVNHIVEETFGDMADQIQGWASQAMDSYGIAEVAAKRYAGTMSAMFQASGTAQSDAAKMATDLVGLAGDLSSFYNIDTETAYNKIKSGMAGMVRPLRELGIDLTVATLKEYALAQGITKSFSAMTQAEKVMLRYRYLMDVTSKQQGDFSRTSMSYANSMRVLRAYIESVKNALGQGLVAALRHVVHAMNIAMKAVLKVANAFRVFMETLFGKNISGGGGMLIDTGDMEEVSDDLGDADDSASGMADGLSDASDKAKKLKHDLSVLPFDELNQLNKDTDTASSSAGSGSGGGGGVGDLGDLDFGEGLLDKMQGLFEGSTLPDTISEWAERIKAAFKAKDWKLLGEEIAWGFNQGIQKLYDLLNSSLVKTKLAPYINAFTTTFNSLVDSLNFYQMGQVVARGIDAIIFAANRTIERIDWNNLGRQFANWANGLIHDIEWDNLGRFFANKLNMFWETAEGFVSNFNWDELGRDLADGAMGFINHIDFDAMINTINGALAGLSITVLNFALKFPWETFGATLALNANKLIDGLPVEEFTTAIGVFVHGAVIAMNALLDPRDGIDFEGLGNKFAEGAMGIVSAITGDDIGDLISGTFNAGIEILRGWLERFDAVEVAVAFKNTLITAIEGIKAEDFGDALAKIVNDIASSVRTFFGDRKLWEGLGEKIGTTLSTFLSEVDTKEIAQAINSIADALLRTIGSAIEHIDANELMKKFGEFIGNLDWGKILEIAALLIPTTLIPAIAGLTITGLKEATVSKIAEMISGAFASTEVTSAVGTFTTTMEGATMSLAGEVGLLTAVMAVSGAVADLYDKLRGGNAKRSVMGGAVDSFINELYGAREISKGLRDEIFLLKEQFESGDISYEEFATKFSSALAGAGVDATTAQGIIKGLGDGLGHLNDNQLSTLVDLVGQLPDKTGEANRAFEELGINGSTAYDNIENALKQYETDRELLHVGEGQMLSDLLEQYRYTGTNAGVALKKIIDDWEELGIQPEAIKAGIVKYLGEDTFNTLISAADGATESVGEIGTAAETAQEKVNKASDSQSKLNENANKTPGILTTLKTLATGFAGKLLGLVFPTAKDSDDAAAHIKTSIESIPTKLQEIAKTASEASQSVVDGIKEPQEKSIEPLTKLAEEMARKPFDNFDKFLQHGSPSKIYMKASESIPEGVKEGINNKVSQVLTAITTMCNKMLNQFKNHLATMKSNLNNIGRDVIQNGLISSMSSAISNGASSIQNSAMSMMNSVINTLNGMGQSFYNAGQNLASWLRSGFESIYIRTPHIVPWGGYYAQFGDTYTWIPDFAVQWYKRGGLFTNPTIAGFGEAGDEAALPLENSRTMSRIASAIVENSGGIFGADEKKLTSAIAAGFVQAMMANQGNRTPVIINAELKTENNETLARAVIDGMKSIDYRNNPTAQFGF